MVLEFLTWLVPGFVAYHVARGVNRVPGRDDARLLNYVLISILITNIWTLTVGHSRAMYDFPESFWGPISLAGFGGLLWGLTGSIVRRLGSNHRPEGRNVEVHTKGGQILAGRVLACDQAFLVLRVDQERVSIPLTQIERLVHPELTLQFEPE